MRDDERYCTLCIYFIIFIFVTVILSLYTDPNLPNLSIEEFSVPAFNKTSNHTAGKVYFDLKLRNMNKAVGLYYDDPFILAFSYYPIQEPYHKCIWECTLPHFYQGNGKTKHIRTVMGQPSMVVEEEEDNQELAPTVPPSNVRSLLKNSLLLPSMVVDQENVIEELTEIRHQELMAVQKNDPAAEVVSFRVSLIVNYRFKLWIDPSPHVLEVGADVVVDANTGERVSKGSIKLVESAAAAGGGPLLLVVLLTSFLLMSV